jgi:mutator family transposase
MAAGPSIDVTGWLEEQLAQASQDLLRSMVQTFAEALMGAETDAVCGAGYGERSTERTNTRNGYRRREWDTRAGTVDRAREAIARALDERRSLVLAHARYDREADQSPASNSVTAAPVSSTSPANSVPRIFLFGGRGPVMN